MAVSILFAGMGHVHSIRKSLDPGELRLIRVHHLDREKRVGGTRDRPRVIADSALDEIGTLCLAIRGNLHTIAVLFDHPLSFHLAPSDRQGRFVTSGPMYRLFERNLAINSKIAESIFGAIRSERHLILSAPPPIVVEDHIRANPGKMADRLDLGLSPTSLRKALFDIQRDVQRDHARRLGAAFLPPPTASMDDDGFLRRDCFKSDPTHANPAQGRLVVDQVKALATA